MLNRILILALALLLVMAGTAVADKDQGDKATHKIVVKVAGDQSASDEAQDAYVVQLEKLLGDPSASAWTVSTDLAPLMLVQEDKLKAAHEKLLKAFESLKESGDLSERGLEKLQTILDEIGEDFKAPLEEGNSLKAMKAYTLAAPKVDMLKDHHKKIIVQKQFKGAADKQRELTITINGDDVKVEGEGYTDEELEQIRQAIKSGKNGILELDGDAIMLDSPGLKFKKLTDLDNEDITIVGEPDDLTELDGKLQGLQLEPKEIPGVPLPGGYVIGKSLTENKEATEAWDKKWQALEEELKQVLSDEQMKRLNELLESRSHSDWNVADEFPELYRQGLLKKWEMTPDGEGNQFYSFSPEELAPYGGGIFQWQGRQLDENWEEELQQMMDSIEQQMRELMLRYKSQQQEHSD